MRPDHPRWLALASGRATFNNEVHVSGPTRVSADIKGDPDSICSLRVLPPLTLFFRRPLRRSNCSVSRRPTDVAPPARASIKCRCRSPLFEANGRPVAARGSHAACRRESSVRKLALAVS